MNERKISSTTEGFRAYGTLEEILALMKESGFTAYDCGMFNGEEAWRRLIESENCLENARALRAYADSINFACNQTHAPFPSARKGDGKFNEAQFPALVRAIKVSGILGAKVCVIHPCNDYTPEENAEKVYLPLAPYAREAGVKIGVENMWNWDVKKNIFAPAACSSPENYVKHMSLLPEDVFVANLDIGHAELRAMNTSAPEMIRALGGYFQSMHLHDVNFYEDSHSLPFVQKTDFEPVIQAMRETGYAGDITLESGAFIGKFPKEVIPAAARLMAAVAAYFKKRLDEKN
ncbi:MAG: sugar phosphate isomerase/epimerase family protein [Candidatus Scatosoma sp.]